MLSRRNFMAAGAATMGLTACGGSVTASSRKIDKIGLQTYTLRDIFEPDPVGTLKMIKEVGYDYVELNRRNFAQTKPEDLAVMVKDAGLTSPATHYSYLPVKDDPKEVARVCNILGCKYAIVPWMDAELRSLEQWKQHAKVFNESGKILADNGIKLAYHNHDFEFEDLGGGTTATDIILSETDPDYVSFEIDLFWSALASVDIKAYFKKYPGRFKLCHIKDLKGNPKAAGVDITQYDPIKKDYMKNVGEGDIDFGEIFKLNGVSGLEYFVAEHDLPQKPFRESIKTSHDSLRALRF